MHTVDESAEATPRARGDHARLLSGAGTMLDAVRELWDGIEPPGSVLARG